MRLSSMIAMSLAVSLTTLAPAARADDTGPRLVKGLTGTWKGALHLTMGADQADLKATIACAPVAGKTGVGCTAQIAGVPGLGTLLESDLFGADGATVHMYAVSNAGDVHDHAGGFSGDALVVVWKGMSPDHHALVETLTFAWPSARKLTFTQDVTADGKPFVRLSGTLAR